MENNQIQLFGTTAKVIVIDMGKEGILTELAFTCTKDITEKIIKESVKRGVPFERTQNGVSIFK